MLKKILFVVLALFAAYLVICTLGKDKSHFKVSKTVPAPPDFIFQQVADFKNSGNWSPWERRDSLIKKTYGTTTTGVGGRYDWTSPNKNSGSGSQEIVEYIPNQKVKSLVHFKDFQSYSFATVDLLDKHDGSTEVTWSFDDSTATPFIFRGMMKLMNFEAMLTKDLNEGLDNLATYCKQNYVAAAAASSDSTAVKK